MVVIGLMMLCTDLALGTVIADEDKPAAVTVDTFRRAETDTYFARFVLGSADIREPQ